MSRPICVNGAHTARHIAHLFLRLEIIARALTRGRAFSAADALSLCTELSKQTGEPFPLQLVCRTLGVPRASVYRYRQLPPCELAVSPRRVGRVSETVLQAAIDQLMKSPPFGQGARQIVAKLRAQGIRVGRGRVMAAMRDLRDVRRPSSRRAAVGGRSTPTWIRKLRTLDEVLAS